MSTDHFTVDGTLIESWDSLKSFKKKDGNDAGPPDDPGNPPVDCEKRTNETHGSTTDPDAKLARKGKRKEAKLSYSAHALIENLNGLLIDLQMDVPMPGRAPQRAGDARQQPPWSAPHHGLMTRASTRATSWRMSRAQGHAQNITQHRGSNIDARTTGHPGYAISQRVRKRVEEVSGWIKTVGNFRRTRLVGLGANPVAAHMLAAAYNLVRLPKLMGAA